MTDLPGRHGWLRGDVALITGGGTGIGRAVARRFAAEGARVVITGPHREVLDRVVADQADPGAWLAVEADVRDTEQLHRAVESAVDRFGKLDVLVPNAGLWDFHRQVTRLSGEDLAGRHAGRDRPRGRQHHHQREQRHHGGRRSAPRSRSAGEPTHHRTLRPTPLPRTGSGEDVTHPADQILPTVLARPPGGGGPGQ